MWLKRQGTASFPIRSKVAAALCLLLGACATADSVVVSSVTSEAALSVRPQTFEQYRESTLRQMRSRRAFHGPDIASELAWNGPREWRPQRVARGTRPKKGILLVHGLGDSPWSFNDIAPELAKHGFLVRTVLLPGHGTRPEDLMNVSVEDWRRVVQQQADTLKRDVDDVYLGGFSTGANLVLEYAYRNPNVAGLVLFSPGFKSLSFDWMAPALAAVRPWLIQPDSKQPLQNSTRYTMVPTNGFAQFYYSSRDARRLLDSRPYDKPVFMVVAEHDSVLDTTYLLKTFQSRFTHPDGRLIWYGKSPVEAAASTRILVRDDRLPDQRISQFSHMGVLFAPSNPLYGENGSSRLCFNGQSRRDTEACEAGAPVWYSDWGYHESGKIHARLTFNPYFAWQASVLTSVLSAGQRDEAASLQRSQR